MEPIIVIEAYTNIFFSLNVKDAIYKNRTSLYFNFTKMILNVKIENCSDFFILL